MEMMKILNHGCLGAMIAGALVFSGTASAADKKAGDAAKGKETFEQCAVCHNVDNDEKKMGPSLKGLFKHDKLKNGKKVTDDTVKAQINTGGNGMPAYDDMLSDKEKGDIIAYLKTL
jgi:mono/diheme cytochrome c family protein